jgi:protein-arginine kinase activator protein McsA
MSYFRRSRPYPITLPNGVGAYYPMIVDALPTENELRRLFPNISSACINLSATETINCHRCGKEFTAFKSQNRKYCSPECAYASPSRCEHITPKERGTTVCAGCGTEFRKKVRQEEQRFCSRRCAGLANAGQLRQVQQVRASEPSKKVELTCETCGRTFTRFPSLVKSGPSFCSQECVRTNPGVRQRRSASFLKSHALTHNNYSNAKRGWREVGGKRVFFRSRMEANYARFLTFTGVDWQFESKTFWFEGLKRGVVSYTPDFYLPSTDEYLELKGWMDPRSKTKLKRMARYHPEVTLRLVTYSEYRTIAAQVRALIADWERDP